jgi:hypothetical protein
MVRREAQLEFADRHLRHVTDEVLVRELEHAAATVLGVDFGKALPSGTRELMVGFWALSEELDRRGLPATVAVEQCRFMFPPL